MNEKPNLYEPIKDSNNKGKGKTIAIVILIILLLGSVGYIVYDKFIKESPKEPIKEEVKKEAISKVMSETEALKLGEEKYLYARDGLYSCGYKSVKFSTERYDDTKLENVAGAEAVVNANGGYVKITNLAEIKSNLTDNAFISWINSDLLTIKGDNKGNYYMMTDCGGNPQYKADKKKIEVKDIYENVITYTIKEYFCNTEDLDKCTDNTLEEYKTTFELSKEDGSWKISAYTDPHNYYKQ